MQIRVPISVDFKKVKVSWSIITLIIVAFGTSSSFASPYNIALHPASVQKNKDLPNFSQVAPGIYRGAAPTAKGMARLKSMGVRTIIDLRIENHGQEEEASQAKRLGIARLRIRLGKEAPTRKQVGQFLSVVNNPSNQPVFVHCQYGADRTGAMVGIYRVTQNHWTFDQAYAEMRKFGFKPFLTELKGAVRQQALPTR